MTAYSSTLHYQLRNTTLRSSLCRFSASELRDMLERERAARRVAAKRYGLYSEQVADHVATTAVILDTLKMKGAPAA